MATAQSSRVLLAVLLLVTILEGSNGFVGSGGPRARPANQNHAATSALPPLFRAHAPLTLQRLPTATTTATTTTSLSATLPQFPALAESLFRYAGTVPLPQAFGINALLFGLVRPKLMKMLTNQGYYHALALATVLWATTGWRGWTTCVLYLFLGSAVTKVKMQEKEKLGIAEGRGGRRGPENVWGSAATGLACAMASTRGSLFGISSELFLLGYVASLATKLSDTFASEIGKAYGKTTFLITTFQRSEPGTEGAVSAEGTAASVVGGTLMSLYGLLVGFITPKAVPISIVAAFVATNIESVLGATLQGKKNLEWMTNEVVNFINTLIGAAIAIGCGVVFL